MLAKRTDGQKASQEKYMQKIKDIKLRVPEEYHSLIKEHAQKKGMSINELVISLLEKDMGIEILTVRKKNKADQPEE